MNFRFSARFATAVSVGEGLAAFAVFLGIIVVLQTLGGAYGSGFRWLASVQRNLDEAAHLVTSLMARDFIANPNFRHPWQFAQQYYYHFPRCRLVVGRLYSTAHLVFGS